VTSPPSRTICVAIGISHASNAADAVRAVFDFSKAPDLRGYAALALAMLDARDARPAIESLFETARTTDPDFLRGAATAMALFGEGADVPLLVRLLREAPIPRSASAVALALAAIGDDAATSALLDVATDAAASDLARSMAIVGLGAVVEDSATPKLHALPLRLNFRALPPALAELLSIS
jgi:HEAT repeat protein